VTLKDTVNTALRESVRSGRRRAVSLDDLRAFAAAAEDLGDPDVMAKAWE
jgi:hypothetical protein